MNKKRLSVFVLVLALTFTTKALASLTFTSNAITGTSASAIDLGSGNTLSLNTINNAPITTGTGLVTLGGGLNVAGNVGIGTTIPAPYYLLDIQRGIGSTTLLSLSGNEGYSASMYFSSSDGSDWYLGKDPANLGNGDFGIMRAGNNALTITNTTGRMGIGTTSPSTFFNIVKTTEQLRLGYNATNYSSFTVNSTGSLTIAETGTNPTITLSSPVITSSTTNKGTVALVGGTATVTVNTGAVCVVSETTTATNGVKGVVSGTTLTITGIGTDTIAYICL